MTLSGHPACAAERLEGPIGLVDAALRLVELTLSFGVGDVSAGFGDGPGGFGKLLAPLGLMLAGIGGEFFRVLDLAAEFGAIKLLFELVEIDLDLRVDVEVEVLHLPVELVEVDVDFGVDLNVEVLHLELQSFHLLLELGRVEVLVEGDTPRIGDLLAELGRVEALEVNLHLSHLLLELGRVDVFHALGEFGLELRGVELLHGFVDLGLGRVEVLLEFGALLGGKVGVVPNDARRGMRVRGRCGCGGGTGRLGALRSGRGLLGVVLDGGEDDG